MLYLFTDCYSKTGVRRWTNNGQRGRLTNVRPLLDYASLILIRRYCMIRTRDTSRHKRSPSRRQGLPYYCRRHYCTQKLINTSNKPNKHPNLHLTYNESQPAISDKVPSSNIETLSNWPLNLNRHQPQKPS